jgi:GAF domain-containing protein
MTSRLLGRSCCLITLVDADKVIWKSVSWTGSVITEIKEEPRYESFCSWVVQDTTGRGVTILDATNDPRCTHMRIKRSLEFYAGVPLIIG